MNQSKSKQIHGELWEGIITLFNLQVLHHWLFPFTKQTLIVNQKKWLIILYWAGTVFRINKFPPVSVF